MMEKSKEGKHFSEQVRSITDWLLPGVVSLLNHNEGDPRLVVWLQLDAGLSDSCQLVLEDVRELALADAVPVHDDPVGLVAARALVEHHQVLFDLIRFQICNFSSAFKSFKEGIHIFSK